MLEQPVTCAVELYALSPVYVASSVQIAPQPVLSWMALYWIAHGTVTVAQPPGQPDAGANQANGEGYDLNFENAPVSTLWSP